jgi:DNA polymerase-3 subunit gamma/tau
MVKTGSVPAGLLFSGPSGSGKTTAARILASALTDAELGYIEVDAASNGGVDAVRTMIDSLRFGTGEPRVIAYDEAQSMSREAYNALLKTLEEPPPGVHFILITTEPEKIPETVKTRVMEFEFQRIPTEAIFDRMVQVVTAEKINITGDLLRLLTHRAQGNLRTALTLLDQVWRAGIGTVESFLDLLGEEDFAPALIAASANGDLEQVFIAFETQMARGGNPGVIVSGLVHCFRDVLVLRSGGKIATTGPGLEARMELATRLGPDRIVSVIKLLWDLRTRVRASDDPVSNVELVLVLMTDMFARGKAAAPPIVHAVKPVTASIPVQAPQRPLTPEELRQRLAGR